jgi:hypothetical protein
LKSLSAAESHGNVQPIRSRYAASFGYGARETATNVTSRAFRCTTFASKLSAQNEQCGQPSSSSGANMKW